MDTDTCINVKKLLWLPRNTHMMTFIFKPDQDMVSMFVHAKITLIIKSFHVNRHTDTQTEASGNITSLGICGGQEVYSE